MFGSLEKMVITAYADGEFDTPVGKPFTVWINPASYIYNYKILYNNRQAQGSPGLSPDFNRVGTNSVSFELTFDATGVIPSPLAGVSSAPADGIVGQIADFQALVLKLNGNTHSPNFVKLAWAQLQFQCRMESMKITYTLFRPDGTPLRAKVAVGFVSFTSESQLAKQANKKSPDLTHILTVMAGDTLPALCHRIYGSSLFYLGVAEANGLNDFRKLVPGTQIFFPPLSGSVQ